MPVKQAKIIVANKNKFFNSLIKIHITITDSNILQRYNYSRKDFKTSGKHSQKPRQTNIKSVKNNQLQ